MSRKTHWPRPSSLLMAAGLGFCLQLSPLARADAGEPVWRMTGAASAQGTLLQLAQQAISLQQAVEQVRKRYKGQVVKAAETEVQGRPAYSIRLVHEGRVREVLVDVESGQILK